MDIENLNKLADLLESKANHLQKLNPSVVITEHEDVDPISYMAFSNLKNIVKDSNEILEYLNNQDDLPQWVDELLAIAKQNISKALGYIRSEKTAESNQDLIKLAAGKYDHINFVPPQSVADSAARGLELRKSNKGKGGLSTQQAKKEGVGSGVARAVSLKNKKTLSPATIRRMKAFFSRHEKNKKADKGTPLSKDKGYIAWLLWGGDAGQSWANKVCNQMDAADKK